MYLSGQRQSIVEGDSNDEKREFKDDCCGMHIISAGTPRGCSVGPRTEIELSDVDSPYGIRKVVVTTDRYGTQTCRDVMWAKIFHECRICGMMRGFEAKPMRSRLCQQLLRLMYRPHLASPVSGTIVRTEYRVCHFRSAAAARLGVCAL